MGNASSNYGWTSLGKVSHKNKFKRKMVEEEDFQVPTHLKEAQEVSDVDAKLKIELGIHLENLRNQL
jgi:hypothetical protein